MASAIIPCLRYEDAGAAILFLCDAFGFLPQAIYHDEEDQRIVHHAQLVLGGDMLMVASARPDEAERVYGWRTPEEVGGITQCLYLIVEDVDAHHARAVAAGAEIVQPPEDNQSYPGRGYTARDPEGHVWSFGSYDPWTPPADA